MFEPPFCPYPECTQFEEPEDFFYAHHGSYHPKCRPHPVPRFMCNHCGRTFSRQTFRMDFRDHKPHVNARLFELLASGVGLRQSARLVGMSTTCTLEKARKIGRHLRRLNLNLRGPLPDGASLQFDEFETYEGRRNTRPLSVPMVIETRSRFVIWAQSAMIPPNGRMTPERRAAIERDARRFGPRKDRSASAVNRTLLRALPLVEHLERVRVDTDMKTTYPSHLRATLGAERVVHVQTSSKLARDERNPLFPINQTEAIARDLMGRLRRESWLVSKRRRWLDVALHVFIAYRNFVRKRFNFDSRSPAQCLGIVPERMTPTQLLSWRQEAGQRSLHPLSRYGESIEEFGQRWRAAA